MKEKHNFDFKFSKMNSTFATRKLQMFGEDELEIRNQGRFMYSLSFSQETGAIGQQTPRNGVIRPKLDREFSAWMRVGSDSTPHFFSSEVPAHV